MIVNSSNTSQSPLVQRNLEAVPTELVLLRSRYAPVPARKKKRGAQKWVIQRVKKSAGKVCVISSGSKGMFERKSREWSIAITTRARPRMKSTEIIREPGLSCVTGLGFIRAVTSDIHIFLAGR